MKVCQKERVMFTGRALLIVFPNFRKASRIVCRQSRLLCRSVLQINFIYIFYCFTWNLKHVIKIPQLYLKRLRTIMIIPELFFDMFNIHTQSPILKIDYLLSSYVLGNRRQINLITKLRLEDEIEFWQESRKKIKSKFSQCLSINTSDRF